MIDRVWYALQAIAGPLLIAVITILFMVLFYLFKLPIITALLGIVLAVALWIAVGLFYLEYKNYKEPV
jgi:peptidoglycan biosynthesis protein MviN/MurJ (putative lipid II flippase)